MQDPVILCETGVSYERTFIQDWLRVNRCGPSKNDFHIAENRSNFRVQGNIPIHIYGMTSALEFSAPCPILSFYHDTIRQSTVPSLSTMHPANLRNTNRRSSHSLAVDTVLHTQHGPADRPAAAEPPPPPQRLRASPHRRLLRGLQPEGARLGCLCVGDREPGRASGARNSLTGPGIPSPTDLHVQATRCTRPGLARWEPCGGDSLARRKARPPCRRRAAAPVLLQLAGRCFLWSRQQLRRICLLLAYLSWRSRTCFNRWTGPDGC
jgi:hypothetical protein